MRREFQKLHGFQISMDPALEEEISHPEVLSLVCRIRTAAMDFSSRKKSLPG
jgi:hypothetical protein